MSISVRPLNYGRAVAYRSFCDVLNDLQGSEEVSEIVFRDEWLARLNRDERLYRAGWYAPPPNGIAVLFAPRNMPSRISFRTLRDEASWPTAETLDWTEGLLFAYCSPVDIETGLMGDFAITLYLGQDERLLRHFKQCHQATKEVLELCSAETTAQELFVSSQRIFNAQGLENSVVSKTDSTPLDLGHSLVRLQGSSEPDRKSRTLSQAAANELSIGRQFISADHNWTLGSIPQFTVEPQLRSISDASLPQITFHYVVAPGERGSLLAECDDLFSQYGLVAASSTR
jgi:hypothetical protein